MVSDCAITQGVAVNILELQFLREIHLHPHQMALNLAPMCLGYLTLTWHQDELLHSQTFPFCQLDRCEMVSQFCSAFPWLLVRLSIFSNVCWPFVLCLLWIASQLLAQELCSVSYWFVILFALFLCSRSSLCVLDTNPLSVVCVWWISSSLWLVFSLCF